ncbi:MAG: type II methionyl aminopeptidase [Candidatus Micrarchaeia archaeon]
MTYSNGSDEIRLFRQAGRVAARARQKAAALAKPGMPLEEFAEKLEAYIAELGCRPAFPINISINNVAAHYTPPKGDDSVFGEKDIVKIDLGAHIGGCCGDTALTLDFSGEHGHLIEAAEAALAAAIAQIRAGAKTSDVGAAIEREISARGLKPVVNLTGHQIKRGTLHAGKVIPNISTRDHQILAEGDIIAVEPFASTGRGRVAEGTLVEIFSFVGRAGVRLPQARQVAAFVEREYGGLPFAERWLYREFPSRLFVQSALKELAHAGALRPHPVLADAPGSLVSQAEHTVLVEKGGCVILTR